MSNQKGFVWLPVLLGILFVALLGGVYAWQIQKPTLPMQPAYTPTTSTDKTTSANTPVQSASVQSPAISDVSKYTDATFGFSFSYPSSWHQWIPTTVDNLAIPPNVIKEFTVQSPDKYDIVRFMVISLTDMKAYDYCIVYSFDSATKKWLGTKTTQPTKANCSNTPATTTEDFNTIVGDGIPAFDPLRGGSNPAELFVILPTGYGLEIETINRGPIERNDTFPIDVYAQKILDTVRISARQIQ